MATSTPQIPVIDISGSLAEKEVAKQLVEAAATCGFVYLKNEGKDIPVEVIDSIFDLSKKFFSSPLEERGPCKINETNNGWVGMHAENLDPKKHKRGDFKEAMNLGEFQNGHAQQPLPPIFVANEAQLDRFHTYCRDLMLKILVLFAIGLEIDDSQGGKQWFASRHRSTSTEPACCTLRLLHYPPLPANTDYKPEVDIRAGAHSDYGSITLLFQRHGQPGLEIIPPSSLTTTSNEKQWTPVPVLPPTTEHDPSPPILVNIGDLLSHWTNNYLKSTFHRVIFPQPSLLPSSTTTKNEGKEIGESRYSIAYFGHPLASTILEPIPSPLIKKHTEQRQERGEGGGTQTGGKAMTAHEHLMERLKATYLGLYRDGEEKVESENGKSDVTIEGATSQPKSISGAVDQISQILTHHTITCGDVGHMKT